MDRLEEIAAEIVSLNLELDQVKVELNKMPKGCNCHSKGKAELAARNEFKRTTLNPVADKIRFLKMEKRSLENG